MFYYPDTCFPSVPSAGFDEFDPISFSFLLEVGHLLSPTNFLLDIIPSHKNKLFFIMIGVPSSVIHR